jgi:hypothetical protein
VGGYVFTSGRLLIRRRPRGPRGAGDRSHDFVERFFVDNYGRPYYFSVEEDQEGFADGGDFIAVWFLELLIFLFRYEDY